MRWFIDVFPAIHPGSCDNNTIICGHRLLLGLAHFQSPPEPFWSSVFRLPSSCRQPTLNKLSFATKLKRFIAILRVITSNSPRWTGHHISFRWNGTGSCPVISLLQLFLTMRSCYPVDKVFISVFRFLSTSIATIKLPHPGTTEQYASLHLKCIRYGAGGSVYRYRRVLAAGRYPLSKILFPLSVTSNSPHSFSYWLSISSFIWIPQCFPENIRSWTGLPPPRLFMLPVQRLRVTKTSPPQVVSILFPKQTGMFDLHHPVSSSISFWTCIPLFPSRRQSYSSPSFQKL